MDKHITVGVAGHVDHGKTSLVRCLTGVDTDRLKEEKRRGLSIEPGVAQLQLPSGGSVALVDVPGHSDYLKNTIRGLACVDAAILVVAADDGVMPQTLDHLELLTFIRAKAGLVVLSKADLVDSETLDLAELEIREILVGTFLEKAPVIAFSALDRRGADAIRAAIESVAFSVTGKVASLPFRLWIDQVRSFSGFGTVSSGTIHSGTLHRDDPIQIFPSGKETKARYIEVHRERVERAIAGQRVGINLHRIPLEDVHLGTVLAAPGSMQSSQFFNAELTLAPKVRMPIFNRQRVKFYTGTSGVGALVVLMEKERIRPGETGLVQFRLQEPLALAPRDFFVISPMNLHTIIGGGSVLEVTREKFRLVKSHRIVSYLQPLQVGDVGSVVEHYFLRNLTQPVTSGDVARETALDLETVRAEVHARALRGEIFKIKGKSYFGRARFNALKNRVPEIVQMSLSHNPLAGEVKDEEIKRRLEPALDDALFQKLLGELSHEGRVVRTGTGCRLQDFKVKLLPKQERLAAFLLSYARDSGLVPFSAGKFCKFNAHVRTFSPNEVRKILEVLCEQGKLIMLHDERYLTPRALDEIKRRVRRKIAEAGSLALDDFQEVLGYGRTRAIPVLEYLDEQGFTVRIEDRRILTTHAITPGPETSLPEELALARGD